MSATTMLGFERQVIGPIANPFALNWVPAGSMGASGERIGEYRPVTGQQDVRQIGGGSLHPGDSNGSDLRPSWHHITMEPIGEAFFAPGEDPPNADEVVSLGNTATILKARIRTTVGNARVHTLDFDVLAGVDFSVAAQHVLSVEALVPDPASIIASPPGILESSFSAVVCTGVYCGLPPRGSRMTLTYTQPFYLASGAALGIMPVVPGAREVEILVDSISAEPGGVVLEFLEILANPIVPSYTDPAAGTFFTLGEVNMPAGASNTTRVTIPGQANAMRISSSLGDVASVVTIIQLLKF